MLKRYLLFLTAFGAFAAAALDGVLFPTVSRNLEDQWRTLAGRPPILCSVSSVRARQPFMLRLLWSGASIVEGKSSLDCTFTLYDPQGEVFFCTGSAPLERVTVPCNNPKAFYVYPQVVTVVFPVTAAPGKYRIEAKLVDAGDGTEKTLTSEIELRAAAAEVKPFETLEELDRWLMGYYSHPDPDRLIPALRKYLESFPELKQKKVFMPLPVLGFFYYAIKENPQLYAELADFVNTLSGEERQAAALVAVHLGGEARDRLAAEARKSIPAGADPFVVTDPEAPWQIDLLWNEFFASGRVAPLGKIVEQLRKLSFGITPEEYKKIKEPTEEDRRNVGIHLMGMAAQWSLKSNAMAHRLVFFYLEGMFKHDQVADPAAKKALAEIVAAADQRWQKAPALPSAPAKEEK